VGPSDRLGDSEPRRSAAVAGMIDEAAFALDQFVD
jgi:hypothetical protein